MSQAKYETVRLEIVDRVATVSLNRPDMRNAFHPTMIRELTEVFTVLGSRKDLSVVVLRGEGKSFCSGADLGYMKSMAGFSFEENEKDSQQLFGMFWSLRSCPHPIVGRLHGHVMGGGLGLAALCDVAMAVNGTQFCFSEVRLGLAPAVISPFVLERMAASHARRFMLTGEVFGVTDALASGLVQYAVDESAVEQRLNEVIKSMCLNGPEAVRATKALIRTMSETAEWSRRREMTTKVIAERRVSDEGQEGLRGFLEKRPPKWQPT
jgi:methylglutaconyl-CoA hydratase